MSKLYTLLSVTGCEWLGWKLTASSCLRILSYHGVCDDSLAGEAWVPKHFVASSTLEEQLRYLREHANVVPLSEAVKKLQRGALPERAVALTFDDGYANNLHAVLPLLKKYESPATVFVSTAFVENGEFFPFDQLRLAKTALKETPEAAESLRDYKNCPLDDVKSSITPYWPMVEATLTGTQRETLRPLTRDEFEQLNSEGDLITIGAHSHTHCILGNELRQRRIDELQTSVNLIRQWTGKEECSFSYPNGQIDDYDEVDKQELKALNVPLAVSGVAGLNRADADLLELRRFPVGMYHEGHAFAAEVIGLRQLLKSAALR